MAAAQSQVFIQPKVLQVPLATLQQGTVLRVVEIAGKWLLVRFDDDTWGSRVGYVNCADVIVNRPPRSSPPSSLRH